MAQDGLLLRAVRPRAPALAHAGARRSCSRGSGRACSCSSSAASRSSSRTSSSAAWIFYGLAVAGVIAPAPQGAGPAATLPRARATRLVPLLFVAGAAVLVAEHSRRDARANPRSASGSSRSAFRSMPLSSGGRWRLRRPRRSSAHSSQSGQPRKGIRSAGAGCASPSMRAQAPPERARGSTRAGRLPARSRRASSQRGRSWSSGGRTGAAAAAGRRRRARHARRPAPRADALQEENAGLTRRNRPGHVGLRQADGWLDSRCRRQVGKQRRLGRIAGGLFQARSAGRPHSCLLV